MKQNILILFAVVSLIISLTGCGGSGSSNIVTPNPTTMTSVRVSLTQNGVSATDAEVALYTPAAAMREGFIQAQNNASSRASISSTKEGVYSPSSISEDGTYTFNVPTGEYTLIANKGTSKAVVTSIRASGDSENPITVSELKPTGTITGKVATGTAPVVTGSIVCLEGTSFVAIATSNGDFTISGVPTDTDFSISAMSNQNGKLYQATNAKVKVSSSDLTVNLTKSLTLNTSSEDITYYKIVGSVVDTSETSVANIPVIACYETTLVAGITDSEGNFTLLVNSEGEYNVMVIGSDESSKKVTVPSEETLSFEVNTSSNELYNSITGTIVVSNDYLSIINEKKFSMPDVDKYLVRLIGTGDTHYGTSTKADYKLATGNSITQDATKVSFSFDSVPDGTYYIFVDPAGNGFLGSLNGSVKVEKRVQKKIETSIEVTFVKPTFSINQNEGGSLSVTTPYPSFVGDEEANVDANIIIRDLYNNINLTDAILSGSGNEFYITNSDRNTYEFPHNGKYEIIIQKSWSDSVTGLSGSLTGTDVINYDSNQIYLGDIPIEHYDQLKAETLANIVNIKYEVLGNNLGTCFSAYDDKKILYCARATYNFNTKDTSLKEDSSVKILDVSGLYAIYSKNTATGGNGLYFHKMNDNSQIFPFDNDKTYYAASIVAHKYIAFCQETESEGFKVRIFTQGSNNELNDTTPDSITENGYEPIAVKLTQKVTDNDYPINVSNSCYVAILYYSYNTHNCKIKVYDLTNNNDVVGQSGDLEGFKVNINYDHYMETIPTIKSFNHLRNGSFYIETDDFNYPALIVNSSGLVDKSSLSNRQSCFMDNHGYFYRYDTINKSIIKTTSLDGKPIDSTSKNATNEFRGILGLNYTDNGLSIIAY